MTTVDEQRKESKADVLAKQGCIDRAINDFFEALWLGGFDTSGVELVLPKKVGIHLFRNLPVYTREFFYRTDFGDVRITLL